MPLVGGGGAPNVSGGNPSGTGSGLNYIGEHAYAYSGAVSVSNSDITILQWNMGTQYLVGKFQPQMMTDANVNDDYYFRIEIDGEIVASVIISNTRDYTPFEEIEIIIAPYSNVSVIVKNATQASANNVGAIITGRVYA